VVIKLVIDATTLSFAVFFVGLFLGVVVPAMANWDPAPNVQRGVQVFLGFMTLLAYAVSSGATTAPAAVVGLLLGFTFAMQANIKASVRSVEMRL
jgi:hypothetical protein